MLYLDFPLAISPRLHVGSSSVFRQLITGDGDDDVLSWDISGREVQFVIMLLQTCEEEEEKGNTIMRGEIRRKCGKVDPCMYDVHKEDMK